MQGFIKYHTANDEWSINYKKVVENGNLQFIRPARTGTKKSKPLGG